MKKILFFTSIMLMQTLLYAQSYCSSTASSASSAHITWVSKLGKNGILVEPPTHEYRNKTTYNSTGYNSYGTDKTIPNLDAGTKVRFALGTEMLNYNNYIIAMWIDFNNNGSFTDSDELVYSRIESNSTWIGRVHSNMEVRVSIPACATEGTRKMRVKMVANKSTISPCGAETAGETEDYFVKISRLTDLSVTSNLSYTCGETSYLSASGGGTGTTYTWYPGATSKASIWVGNQQDATYEVHATMCGKTVKKQVKVFATKLNASNVTVACGDYAKLSASSNYPGASFTWTGPGIAATSGSTITVGPIKKNTTYTVKFTDACGKTYTKEVQAIAQTVLNGYGTTVRCGKDVASISASSNYTKATFKWTGPNISSPVYGSRITVTYPKTYGTHNYKVEITDGCGVVHSKTVPVVVNPPLIVTSPSPVCANSNYTLSATGTKWVSWWTIDKYGKEFKSNDFTVPGSSATSNQKWRIWSGGNNDGCPDFNRDVIVNVTYVETKINGTVVPHQGKINVCTGKNYTVSGSGTDYYSWWVDTKTSQGIIDTKEKSFSATMGSVPVVVNSWAGSNKCGSIKTTYTINPVACRLGDDVSLASDTKLSYMQLDNKFYIHNPGSEVMQVELINMQGRVVKQMNTSVVEAIIDSEDLPGGIYILNASTGSDNLQQKVIINY